MNNLNGSWSNAATGFAFVLGTIFFTVYGQLIVKWQVSKAGAMPALLSQKAWFMVGLLLNPWVISGMAAGFAALVCWLAAMTKFELSYAYPFMSLAFVLVLILSAIFFNEAITAPKAVGVLLVMIGIAVASRG